MKEYTKGAFQGRVEWEEGSILFCYVAIGSNRRIANGVPVVPCIENLMEIQLTRPVVGNKEKDTTKL